MKVNWSIAQMCFDSFIVGSTGIKTTIICPYFMQTQKLHGSAKLRLIRGVTPEEVADRTIKAIIDDEQIVFMPSWFKYALLGRW